MIKATIIETPPCSTIDQAYENLQRNAPACTEFNGTMLMSTDTLDQCYAKVYNRMTGGGVSTEQRIWEAALAFYAQGNCSEESAVLYARNFVKGYQKYYCETMKQNDHETNN